MLYCTYEQYQTAGGALDEAAFDTLCARASRLIDRHTFGRAEPPRQGLCRVRRPAGRCLRPDHRCHERRTERLCRARGFQRVQRWLLCHLRQRGAF